MVVERDTVLVPAGWDSWGKIRVLREGFDCEGASSEWDDDLDDNDETEGGGTRKVYEEVIPDPEADEQVEHAGSGEMMRSYHRVTNGCYAISHSTYNQLLLQKMNRCSLKDISIHCREHLRVPVDQELEHLHHQPCLALWDLWEFRLLLSTSPTWEQTGIRIPMILQAVLPNSVESK